jgi:hypothetical protein
MPHRTVAQPFAPDARVTHALKPAELGAAAIGVYVLVAGPASATADRPGAVPPEGLICTVAPGAAWLTRAHAAWQVLL